MIISYGRRYIFVHAPKTGGTSLALALEARAMKDDIMLGDTPKAARRRRRVRQVQTAGRLWKHSSLRDVEGLITRGEMRAFFVLTLVRNPWDRLVSYYHWLRVQSFDHVAVRVAQGHEFQGFLRHRLIRQSLRDHPYGSYVRDKDGVDLCNLYVRLEHMAEDLIPFHTHLGFDLGPMPHANRSDRARDYRGYYTDEDAEIVAETCAEDIDRFGYGFERG